MVHPPNFPWSPSICLGTNPPITQPPVPPPLGLLCHSIFLPIFYLPPLLCPRHLPQLSGLRTSYAHTEHTKLTFSIAWPFMSPNIRGSSLTGMPSRVQRGEERGSPELMHSRVMSFPIFTCTGPSGSTDTVGGPERKNDTQRFGLHPSPQLDVKINSQGGQWWGRL